MTTDKRLSLTWEIVLSGAGAIVAKDNILYSIGIDSPVSTGVPLNSGDMIRIDDGDTLWCKALKWTAEIAIIVGD